MTENILNLGAVAVIFILAIKEFFSYLKTRNTTNSADTLSKSSNGISELILKELQIMNNNHLHTLQDVISTANNRLIEEISRSNLKIIELLGEIKGNLKQ